MNPQPPTLGEAFCAVDDSFRIVSLEEFTALYVAKASEMNSVQNALLRSHIIGASGEDKQVKVLCEQTVKALEKIGYNKKMRSLRVAMKGFRKGE
jgi:hypothetical protein